MVDNWNILKAVSPFFPRKFIFAQIMVQIIFQDSGKYLRKEVKDEVYFWHTDKHGSLLQVDTIILGVCNQACLKYPKHQVYYLFAIS